MKIMPKIITLVFFVLTGFFFIHQVIVGNPFQDFISPAAVILMFFFMGGVCLFAVFRFNKN